MMNDLLYYIIFVIVAYQQISATKDENGECKCLNCLIN